MAKLKITQADSLIGNTYLIYQWDDKNTHECFEIYKLVDNIKDVAREFGVCDKHPNGKNDLNTRVMCEEMMEIIDRDKLYTDTKKSSPKIRKK